MKKLPFSLLSLLVLLLFSACNQPAPPKISIQDGGLLSKKPCGPPCFFNINPGTTTEEGTEQILKDRGFWDYCVRFDNEASSGQRGIQCDQAFSIFFQKDSNVVEGIGYGPEEDISIQNVIAAYGEPDAMYLSFSGLPEYPKREMILYFDHINTVIKLPEMEGEYQIKPETKIESVSYSSELSYEYQRNNYSSKWKGYGIY